MPSYSNSARPTDQEFAAIVLCGGKSSRMGENKAAIVFGRETLLERVCRQARDVASRVVVVAAKGQVVDDCGEGIDVIADDNPESGPLGGFLTGLRFLSVEPAMPRKIFLIACDTPFVSANILKIIGSQLQQFDAAVVEHHGRLNPLIGVYAANVLSKLTTSFAAGERSLSKFLQPLHVRVLQSGDVSDDPQWPLNVNTTDDLAEARSILDAGS